MNSEWPPWRFRLCSEQKKNSAWSSRMDAKAMTLHALISNCPSSRPNRLSHNYPRLVHQLCGKCNISNNNLRLLNGIIGPEEARPPNPDWEVRRFFIHLECHPLLKTYMRGQFTGKCEKNRVLQFHEFFIIFVSCCFYHSTTIICETIFQNFFFLLQFICHFWSQFFSYIDIHTIYICLSNISSSL